MERLLIPTFEFPPYAGGVGTFCVEMAKSLAARGIAVTILAPDYGKAEHPDDATYPFAVERFPASGYSAKVLPTLVRALLARRTRFDRWLIADWPFIIAAGIARTIARLPPFRIFLHGTDALILAQGKVPKLLRTTNVFAHAEAVIANSEYTLSIARANHRSLTNTPTHVALLGVNPYWFDDAGDTAAVKARLGIPDGRSLLLSVSRVDERKGHRLMIAAVAALPDDLRRRVVYVIAGRPGDAGYQARLAAMAAETDATILFTGGLAQDDVRALYASADLFLLVGENRTDKIEGFGLVYLEAAGQSIPSIASPVGGVPEVVLDESTGLLVDDRDPASTTAAIARLLTDDATRQRFGTAARERARTLTWQRCADVTMDIDPARPLPTR